MENSLLIGFNGEKIQVTIKELLYQDNPAWQVVLPDGKQFVLRESEGKWALLTEGEADPDLAQIVGEAINRASITGRGPFAGNDIPAPPPELF
ncbi:hypothetical protein [Arcticibacter sp.]|uniref:hypothetical protein n=1 Tax=Arcticibacter sp. TaxID=1872630 RepID=UPI003890A61D